MLGLLRNVIENFDLRRFPHKYPQEHGTRYTYDDLKNDPKNAGKYRLSAEHGHLKKYFDFHRGYTSFYDVGVYIIVFVFMCVLLREVFIYFGEERNKSYMVACLIVLGICAVLY